MPRVPTSVSAARGIPALAPQEANIHEAIGSLTIFFSPEAVCRHSLTHLRIPSFAMNAREAKAHRDALIF